MASHFSWMKCIDMTGHYDSTSAAAWMACGRMLSPLLFSSNLSMLGLLELMVGLL